jgi:hypothetical protein
MQSAHEPVCRRHQLGSRRRCLHVQRSTERASTTLLTASWKNLKELRSVPLSSFFSTFSHRLRVSLMEPAASSKRR